MNDNESNIETLTAELKQIQSKLQVMTIIKDIDNTCETNKVICLPTGGFNFRVIRKFMYRIDIGKKTKRKTALSYPTIDEISKDNYVSCGFEIGKLPYDINFKEIGVYSMENVTLELVCIEYRDKFIEPKIYHDGGIAIPPIMLQVLARSICKVLPKCYDMNNIEFDSIEKWSLPFCEYYQHNIANKYENNEILLRFTWPMMKFIKE